ncbi:hypothetical protein TEA_016563 [Camellia sinensis var. sinensis]|uniref:PA domain-containing protein n=1 Tax=Camellia sinensis var. sinensis TaxID=542762 RepID=A0A4S4D711_CAMSN|nr:hypothetical protein TEA_016563 [Camellia sinensis var. sinensis]
MVVLVNPTKTHQLPPSSPPWKATKPLYRGNTWKPKSIDFSVRSKMAQSFSTTIAKPTSIFTSTPSSPLCTLVFVVILCILGLYTLQHHHRPEPQPVSNSTPKQSSSKNDFRDIFLTAATNNTLSSYLRALTLHPHLAGTPQAVQTALYVETHFRDLGLQTHVKHYNALLSYPTHASLSAHFSDGTIKDVALAEQGVAGDDDVVRPYHAYSPSGSAYGRAVFVNYGREEDYRALLAQGVSVSGCVAVARRGDLSRNSVVEKAAEKGLAAVLMYAETEGFSGGVERGTVMKGLGDPLTPGWASSSVDVDVDVDGERLGLDDNEVVSRFPKIPSMPISADSAETILRSLEGARVPYEWRANLKSKVARAGPGPTMLNFTYQSNGKNFKGFINIFIKVLLWCATLKVGCTPYATNKGVSGSRLFTALVVNACSLYLVIDSEIKRCLEYRWITAGPLVQRLIYLSCFFTLLNHDDFNSQLKSMGGIHTHKYKYMDYLTMLTGLQYKQLIVKQDCQV